MPPIRVGIRHRTVSASDVIPMANVIAVPAADFCASNHIKRQSRDTKVRSRQSPALLDVRRRVKPFHLDPQPIQSPRMKVADLCPVYSGIRQVTSAELLTCDRSSAFEIREAMSPRKASVPRYIDFAFPPTFHHSFIDNHSISCPIPRHHSFLTRLFSRPRTDVRWLFLHRRSRLRKACQCGSQNESATDES